jgi:hypothetical protein
MAFLVMSDDVRRLTPAQLRRLAERWDIDPTQAPSALKNAILNHPKNRTTTAEPVAERYAFYDSLGSRDYGLIGRDWYADT